MAKRLLVIDDDLSTIPKPNTEIKNCFCDNFVGKPFDLWKLENTIKHYCPV